LGGRGEGKGQRERKRENLKQAPLPALTTLARSHDPEPNQELDA